MKKQLQSIALIVFHILLMIGFGEQPVWDFDFRPKSLFVRIVSMAFPNKKH